MTDTGRVTLKVTRRFSASPEAVFDAWLDPQTIPRWLFTTPTGRIVHVAVDARVGGTFVVTRRDGEDIEHVGQYLQIERPARLAFNLSVPRLSSATTRVGVDIVPRDSGCELTLTHEGVLPEWSERTRSGWSVLLDALAALLGSS